jgi:hypothetical protein
MKACLASSSLRPGCHWPSRFGLLLTTTAAQAGRRINYCSSKLRDMMEQCAQPRGCLMQRSLQLQPQTALGFATMKGLRPPLATLLTTTLLLAVARNPVGLTETNWGKSNDQVDEGDDRNR